MNTLTYFQEKYIKGVIMGSEVRENATHRGGQGYVHPRSDKYRDNYDAIFKKPVEGEEEDGG